MRFTVVTLRTSSFLLILSIFGHLTFPGNSQYVPQLPPSFNPESLAKKIEELLNKNSHPQSSRPNQPQPFNPQSSKPIQPQPFNPQSPGNRGFNPQSSGPNGFNPQSSGPNGFNPQSSGPNGFNPQSSGPNGFNPQSSGPNGFNPQSSGPNRFNPQSSGPNGFNPQSSGPNSFNPHSSGPNGFNPQSSRPNGFNSQPFNPQSSIPNSFNPQSFNPQSSRPNSFNPSQFNPQSSRPNNFNLQPFNPHSSGPNDFNPRPFNPQSSAPNGFNPQSFNPQSSGPNGFNPHPSNPQSSGPNHSKTFNQPPSGSNGYNPQHFQPHTFTPSDPGLHSTKSNPSNHNPSKPETFRRQEFRPHVTRLKPVSKPATVNPSNSQSSPSTPKPDTTHSNSPVSDTSTSKTPTPSSSNLSTSGPKSSNSNNPGSKSSNAPSADSSRSTVPIPDSSISNIPTSDSSKTPVSDSSGPAASDRSSQQTLRPASSSKSSKRDPLRDFRIVCIFNNRHYYRAGFSPANIDPSICTHINYEFAILDPKTYEIITGEPDLDVQQNFFQQAIDLRTVNPKLKVILSLGGWADSTKKYSEMAEDPDKRKNFIEKAISFLKSHEFDGLDVAWEYPNCWQGAIGIHPADKKNFLALLKEMKPQFKENKLILSASVGAIKREVEAAYDVKAVSEQVDYLNVMTYDMHGPWEKKTGHHTQFDVMDGDDDPYCNVKGGMNVWISSGANPKKLNLGLAFYGKTFTLQDPTKCGMGDPIKGVGNPGPESGEGGFILYNEMCLFLNSGNWTEKEDKKAGFYAYSGDQWACYDPPMMVTKKAKYVVDSGLGGVLIKDISGDDYKGVCFSTPFLLTKMVRLQMISRIRKLHL